MYWITSSSMFSTQSPKSYISLILLISLNPVFSAFLFSLANRLASSMIFFIGITICILKNTATIILEITINIMVTVNTLFKYRFLPASNSSIGRSTQRMAVVSPAEFLIGAKTVICGSLPLRFVVLATTPDSTPFSYKS